MVGESDAHVFSRGDLLREALRDRVGKEWNHISATWVETSAGFFLPPDPESMIQSKMGLPTSPGKHAPKHVLCLFES